MKRVVINSSQLIDIACEVIAHTDKAILVNDGTKKVWLPLSQIEQNDDNTVTMPEWLAIEKELI